MIVGNLAAIRSEARASLKNPSRPFTPIDKSKKIFSSTVFSLLYIYIYDITNIKGRRLINNQQDESKCNDSLVLKIGVNQFEDVVLEEEEEDEHGRRKSNLSRLHNLTDSPSSVASSSPTFLIKKCKKYNNKKGVNCDIGEGEIKSSSDWREIDEEGGKYNEIDQTNPQTEINSKILAIKENLCKFDGVMNFENEIEVFIIIENDLQYIRNYGTYIYI